MLPGFRIVVIVDRVEAYQNLDLPLLNRFEKQLLTAREVLTPAQRAVVDELTAWCSNIMLEADLPSIQETFMGFHTDTVASLVIAQWPLIEEVGWQHPSGVKRALARIAHPIAVFRSAELAGALGVAAAAVDDAGVVVAGLADHVDLAAAGGGGDQGFYFCDTDAGRYRRVDVLACGEGLDRLRPV